MIVLKNGKCIMNSFDMKEFLEESGVDVFPAEIQEFIRILCDIEPENVNKLIEDLKEAQSEIEELEEELEEAYAQINELKAEAEQGD